MRKIAVVAITAPGSLLGERVAAGLAGIPDTAATLFVPARFADRHRTARPFDCPLPDLCRVLFQDYRGLVMIMALGIVFRLLAPLLNDKRTDPAVVVLDEKGQFVISVLSGHLGGANDLARYLAGYLGTRAVITTATDVHGLPAFDVLARQYNLAMEPFAAVRELNAALVNGEPVAIFTNICLEVPRSANLTVRPLAAFESGADTGGWTVLVTGKLIKGVKPGTLFLRPRNLVVGIGCRRGVTGREIQDAVKQALEMADRSFAGVRLLATVDFRLNEPGLIGMAEEWGIPLTGFSREEIEAVFKNRASKLSYSDFVFQKIGVGGVCEPAALLAAPGAGLILPKTKLGGVTVAVAEESWQ
ncbi:MAG: cobalamin biosynthesis protein CbiG [Peptococcaceae bacterium]|nr:MAG: cobalamin biosynthesis protein CbiG [Peptococcaceae bacterium]